ncbi:glutathione S-transferase [Hoeflea poritis]|uniref:Glutathione S-transferase n=1 Tax=Hoeflea poritis TaxID=2993659 RepID=A0ABT4VRE7_9HYPH|nr:glutathione S-transferase [Hoeflea poritis]MDA4847273.1 glutathione S-transferase [Hoeflea poritis]
MTSLPILYSFRRCPYAMRARLALRSSGTAVELREVVLRDKAPEFLEASPSATVPALVEPDGGVIDESLDIMLWALERNDPEGWLSPETGSLDDMLALIEHMDGPFKQSLDRYKYDTRHPDHDRLEERGKAAAELIAFEERLAETGWLFGSRPSLADFAILPFVRQFANADRAWFDGEDWLALKAWLGDFERSDRFAAIMDKYPKWQAGDPVTVFGDEIAALQSS